MNELALIDDILQRSREKLTLQFNRNELGSLMGLLKLVNYENIDNELKIQMMNDQIGKMMIRFMQKLMNYKVNYSLTLSATERYVITEAMRTINPSKIGTYENTLIVNLMMQLH